MERNQLIVFIVILLTVLGLELGMPALSSADSILYLPLVLNNYSIPDNQAIIIDHTTANLSKIPAFWINKAKELLRNGYGHTSHGSQPISGLQALKNNPVYKLLCASSLLGGEKSVRPCPSLSVAKTLFVLCFFGERLRLSYELRAMSYFIGGCPLFPVGRLESFR